MYIYLHGSCFERLSPSQRDILPPAVWLVFLPSQRDSGPSTTPVRRPCGAPQGEDSGLVDD